MIGVSRDRESVVVVVSGFAAQTIRNAERGRNRDATPQNSGQAPLQSWKPLLLLLSFPTEELLFRSDLLHLLFLWPCGKRGWHFQGRDVHVMCL
jgi:hypothetical protein